MAANSPLSCWIEMPYVVIFMLFILLGLVASCVIV